MIALCSYTMQNRGHQVRDGNMHFFLSKLGARHSRNSLQWTCRIS